MCRHSYYTKANERIYNTVPILTPKWKIYSKKKVLEYCDLIVIGIKNWGLSRLRKNSECP